MSDICDILSANLAGLDDKWEFGFDLPSENGFDAGSQGATTSAAPVNEPENDTAGLVEQPGSPLPPIPDSWEEFQENMEQAEEVVLFNADAVQQPPVAPYSDFGRFSGQETEPAFLPAAIQQAGPYYVPGADMPPLQQHVAAAPPPAAFPPGPAPFPGQEMHAAQAANARKRKWGTDALLPSELPEEDGRYAPRRKVGPQKNPQKKRCVDQEPGERHDSIQAGTGTPVDNQEPAVTKQPKNPERPGPTAGWPGAIKWHRRNCLNPAAGCEKCCTLHLVPEKYEKLRTTRSKKLGHLPPENQVKLWDHCEQ